MRSIGTKAASMMAGACTPTPATATTRPSDAARLYPGAVEATPMTTLDTKPIAPVFRPFSPASDPVVAGACPTSPSAMVAMCLLLLVLRRCGTGCNQTGARRLVRHRQDRLSESASWRPTTGGRDWQASSASGMPSGVPRLDTGFPTQDSQDDFQRARR